MRPLLVNPLPFAVVALLAFLLGLWAYNRQDNALPILRSGMLLPQPRPIATTRLVFTEGQPFDHASRQGRWTVVFIGYTSCPEACPTTLAQLHRAKVLLGETAQMFQVVFLSVDPERDTPEHLARYTRYFDPTFRAATGTLDQLDGFAVSVGAVFLRQKPDAHDYYAIDHSLNLILIDPEGRMAGYLRPPFAAETIAADLSSLAHWRRR